jgi:hypothetical protein
MHTYIHENAYMHTDAARAASATLISSMAACTSYNSSENLAFEAVSKASLSSAMPRRACESCTPFLYSCSTASVVDVVSADDDDGGDVIVLAFSE